MVFPFKLESAIRFAAVRWSLLAHSGHSLRRKICPLLE
jgi:hypothetical protein